MMPNKVSNNKHIGFLAPTVYRYIQGQGYGGAELQVIQLSRILTQAGYKVTIMTNDFGQPDEELFENIHIVKAPLRFLGGSNLYFLPDTLRFIKQVKKLQLDWCFLLTPCTALFQLGLAKLFCRNMKICKYIASDLDCQRSANLPYYLYKLGLKMSDCVLFQTATQKAMAEKNLHITGGFLPNTFIPPQETSDDVTKDIDVLWVGQFDSWKCPDRLLEIAEKLPQYKFAVISKPISAAYRALEEKIRSLNNVDFIGTVPFEKTQSYFKCAKLYLSTSAVEGFPNTFLQAWYAKSPVVSVSFPCDGILQKENCGRLSGSLDNAVKDIVELVENSHLRQQLGLNGYHYLLKNHNPADTIKILESVIQTGK